MSWPYLPTRGRPEVPGWLYVLILVAAIGLFLAVVYLLMGPDPDCSAGANC